MKWGTRAQVFSKTLALGNSKNEIRHWEQEGKKISKKKVKSSKAKNRPVDNLEPRNVGSIINYLL